MVDLSGPPTDPEVPLKSWVFLLITTIIGMVSYQQRIALPYIFAYQDPEMNPFYTLAAEYPETVDYYGLLAGLAFNLPYCVVGLYAGSLVDQLKGPRAKSIVFSLACIGWSASTLA